MKNIAYIFICTSVLSTTTLATTDQLFTQAKSLSKTNTQFSLKVGIDLVNDTVDIFDIREAEGVKGDSGDYKGFHIKGDYQITPHINFEGAYWHRKIEYGIDDNTIHTPYLSLIYSPETRQNNRSALDFKMSMWGNISDKIKKTSPTQVNNFEVPLQNIQVHDAQDFQFQLEGIFSHKIDLMNQVNIFTGIGYSKVSVERLQFQTPISNQMNGCAADVMIDSNNQYIAITTPACDENFSTSILGDASEFGLDINKNLNYDAYFASLGGSWNWRYKQFESQLAYQYQYLWRNEIDERVSSFGSQAIKDNHSIGAKFSYDFNPTFTGYMQGTIYQHNLIGYIPFLYNGVTASRLDKRYGLVSFGIKFHAF